MNNLRLIFLVFAKLGFIAFGGPAAAIAMFEEEIVTRREWLTREHFLDLVGATNLIPGPNSTEMAMHIGYERGGWPGLFIAGGCFIIPSCLMTGALAWAYAVYGDVPAVEPFLFGIKPAVLAVIATAVWRLGGKAVKSRSLAVLGVVAVLAVMIGGNEILVLFATGIGGMLWVRAREKLMMKGGTVSGFAPVMLLGAAAPVAERVASSVPFWKLFFYFLKIGAILYGSGYVLVAFLEGELVNEFGWLTQEQLLDAIAIGQFTPGPLLSTATFIGYLIGGGPGAVAATVGIFLPSFIFVLILNPWIPRMRRSPWLGAFLDAVNVAAIALMVAVTINLGRTALINWQAVVIAIVSLAVALKWKVNAAWLVIGGAIAGYFLGAGG